MKTVAYHSLTHSLTHSLALVLVVPMNIRNIRPPMASDIFHPSRSSTTLILASPAQILALSVNNSPPHNLRLILAAFIFLLRYLEWKISD